jgi:hypothetical protein
MAIVDTADRMRWSLDLDFFMGREIDRLGRASLANHGVRSSSSSQVVVNIAQYADQPLLDMMIPSTIQGFAPTWNFGGR